MTLDDEPTSTTDQLSDGGRSADQAAEQPAAPARRRRAARRPAGPPEPAAELVTELPVVATATEVPAEEASGPAAEPDAAPAVKAPRKRASRARKAAAPKPAPIDAAVADAAVADAAVADAAVADAAVADATAVDQAPSSESGTTATEAAGTTDTVTEADPAVETAPVAGTAPRRRRSRKAAAEVLAQRPDGQAPGTVAEGTTPAGTTPAGTAPAGSIPEGTAPGGEVPITAIAEVTGQLPAGRTASGRTASGRRATGRGASGRTAADDPAVGDGEAVEDEEVAAESGGALVGLPSALAMPLFQAPDVSAAVPRRARRAASRPAGPPQPTGEVDGGTDPEEGFGPATEAAVEPEAPDGTETEDLPDGEGVAGDFDDDEESTEPGRRRRRRRGGRGRRGRGRGGDDAAAEDADGDGEDDAVREKPDENAEEGADGPEDGTDEVGETTAGSRRRRRRRRRATGAGDAEPGPDDPPNTVVKVREARRSGGGDDVTGLRGSTRLEAKKQRRREGREAGRRRPVITEAEFLARRESVERVMVVREREGRTQIGVLEDGVLVEHYVARRTQTSTVGNVYLGKVQNVLPSMEAAFVDIGKGRNAVLYAGEVNWDAAGLEGQPKRIEHALKSGESVLAQVTKDPIGHKGARLTSQISLPGRYLVYVPDGSMTGISRKLPDTERNRLKKILRTIVPDDAGVIVRTAAEGASEEELERDVARLRAQAEDITRKAGAVNPPSLLYGEPDLAIRVVRDIFNEDFSKLVVSGDDTWDTLQAYIGHVAPDLVSRLERWEADGDAFASFRIDEQLAKALDRKVWLPSGGSLVIDRTEAMTVVDVNTGKFTGAGGNLEETVTKNNLEAAEEIVRQLRLRDIGGIIVVDFIDMVLESNRELVMRRLLECLGRDRTKHQVAEVTSLGLVQMTRKRVGQGLLEVFSETCEHCGGRGIILHDEPVEKRQQQAAEGGRARGSGGSGGGSGGSGGGSGGSGGSGGGSGRRSRGRGSSEGSGSAAGGEAAEAASSAASA